MSTAQQPEEPAPERPVVLVLFGATGDLSRRMVLPALSELAEGGRFPQGWRLVATGRQARADEDFRNDVAEALREFGGGLPERWEELSGRVSYARGGFTE